MKVIVVKLRTSGDYLGVFKSKTQAKAYLHKAYFHMNLNNFESYFDYIPVEDRR